MHKVAHAIAFGTILTIGVVSLSTSSLAEDPIEKAEEGKMAPGSEMSSPSKPGPIEQAEEGKMSPGAGTPGPASTDPIEEAEQGQ